MLYINTYKKIYKNSPMSLLQERNGDADLENGLVGTVGEGEGGTS